LWWGLCTNAGMVDCAQLHSVFKFELIRLTGGKKVNVGNLPPVSRFKVTQGYIRAMSPSTQSWVSSTLIQTLVLTHTVFQIIVINVGLLTLHWT